jgi:hypothetical protein
MNTNKIATLKKDLDTAVAAHDKERDRLAACGLKSGERYVLLKPLKATVDAANAAYVKYAHSQIKNELDAIIAQQTPEQRAEGLRRARGV